MRRSAWGRGTAAGVLLGWTWLAAGLGACKRAPSGPPPMAIVTGRVLGAGGEPLPSAPVTLTPQPDDGRVPIASVRTDGQGWFRIERVPAGKFEVHARAAGHVESWRSIETGATGAGVVELTLGTAVTLAGRIEDSRHAPVPLARVVAFAESEAQKRRLHETRSDERGAFTIGDIPPGPHRLLIEAPGLGTASAGPIVAPDPAVVVVLPGEIRALVGRVSRNEQPVRGAKVRLGGESVLEPRSAETDGEGRFAFTGLGPGSYVVRAELGGSVSPIVSQTVGEGPPASPRRLDLALAPGRYAGGVVTDESGKPVAGASVQVDVVPPSGLWAPVLTDGSGRWASQSLPPGTYRIRARRPGFVARRAATVEIAAADGAAAPTIGVKLELVRTGRITGTVVNDKNAPLAGATVYDRLAEAEELGVIWSRLPMAAEAAALPSGSILPAVGAVEAAGSRRVISDGAGRFMLREVPPGRVRIEVLSAGAVPLRTSPFRLAPGGELDVGTLHVQGAIQVAGTVVDADGTPLAGARVVAAPTAAAAVSSSGLYALSGGDGGFSLPLGVGEHRLIASDRGRADATATVRVVAGTPPPPVILRFSKVGNLVVNGVVKDTAGRPLARARVLARPLEGDVGVGAAAIPAAAAGGAVATTDAGGSFRLTGLAPGSLRLEIVGDNYGTYRTTLVADAAAANGGPVVIAVPVPGAIEGEVHEKVTGAPVPGFQIEADGPEGVTTRFPEAAARRRGGDPLRFSLRKLTPGRWMLRLRAAGYVPLVHQMDVPAASAPGEISVRDLRLEMARQ